jgi:four helix bundle protein
MQDFRKLHAWQKSHALALRTYALTANFPKAELFGLTSQMRRAAVSVPANIAEGCYRDSQGVQAQSLRIALGSAGELEYYMILAADLKLISVTEAKTMMNEVSDVKRVVTGFLKAVATSAPDGKRQTVNRKTVNGKRSAALPNGGMIPFSSLVFSEDYRL